MKKKAAQKVGAHAGVEGKWEVKVAHSAQDWRRAKEALGREHGLGAGSEAGDRLCQLVMEEGKLAGVLVWCAGAWHLKERDEAVGWDAVNPPPTPARSRLGCRPTQGCFPAVWPSMAKAWETAAAA